MIPEKAALAVVWQNKRFWLLQSLGIAVWIALALSWFWLPDSQVWGIVLAVVQGIVVLVSGVWLIRTALAFYGKEHGRRHFPKLSLRFLFDVALLIALGAFLPYKLIGWHPQLQGLTLQTASLVIRFSAAFLLAVSAWLILASLLGRLGTDSAEGPVQSS